MPLRGAPALRHSVILISSFQKDALYMTADYFCHRGRTGVTGLTICGFFVISLFFNPIFGGAFTLLQPPLQYSALLSFTLLC